MTDVILQSKVAAGDCVVVYSKATGRIRRWIVSDTDEEIKQVALLEGEDFYHVGKDVAKLGTKDLANLQTVVNAETLKTPVNDRYVVIQDTKILTAIYADPLCGDRIPGCELIAHETADCTWTYDPKTGEFTPPPRSAEDLAISEQAAKRKSK